MQKQVQGKSSSTSDSSISSIAKWRSVGYWFLPAIFVLLFPLALLKGGIWTDEAWIGQQVHSLLTRGVIVSDFFHDFPPLDQQILVYHKLLVWAGAAVSYVAGWGIFQLRGVSAMAGLLTLLAIYFGPADLSRRVRLTAIAILAFTPLFWEQMMMFRPEMLMALCGFSSYLFVRRYLISDRVLLIALAGVLAGMAGLAHAAGLAFALAGVIALAVERRYKAVWIFCVCAALAFAPFFSGWLVDRALFGQQLFANRSMATSLSFEWWRPLANLVEDHKRIFRKPDIIGLSVLAALALLLANREDWRKHRFFVVYTAILLIITGMTPLPKMSRYMLPLTPFFALAAAWVIEEPPAIRNTFRRRLRTALYAWVAVFFVYGIVALGQAAFVKSNGQLDDNRAMKSRMKSGSLVMAPFDFIFPDMDDFTIQSWWGCEKANGQHFTPEAADRYADSLKIDYLVLNDEYMKKLALEPSQLRDRFLHYRPMLEFEREQRFLLERKAEGPIDK
jgi:hypothetical protein